MRKGNTESKTKRNRFCHFVDWLFKILLILQCKSIRKNVFWEIYGFFGFLIFLIFWDFFEKIRGCTRIFSSWQPLGQMLTLKLTTLKRLLLSNVGLSFFVYWVVSFAVLIYKMLYAFLLPFSDEFNQRYWKTIRHYHISLNSFFFKKVEKRKSIYDIRKWEKENTEFLIKKHPKSKNNKYSQ